MLVLIDIKNVFSNLSSFRRDLQSIIAGIAGVLGEIANDIKQSASLLQKLQEPPVQFWSYRFFAQIIPGY
jgi:hypothetical protein